MNVNRLKKRELGFTAIEILLSITMTAVLGAIAFFALNPVVRSADARNKLRFDHSTSILQAIQLYKTDNNGALPNGLFNSMPVTQIGTQNSGCQNSCQGTTTDFCINLNGSLAKYLNPLPVEPQTGTQFVTGYYVSVDEHSVITVGACTNEKDTAVFVSE